MKLPIGAKFGDNIGAFAKNQRDQIEKTVM